MRRIDLTPYTVTIPSTPEPITIEPGEHLIDVLNAGNFTPSSLIARTDLLKLIKESIEDNILLLEEADWDKVVAAFNEITGFSIAHDQFVRSVIQAEKVKAKVLEMVPKIQSDVPMVSCLPEDGE
jgi:hypothetical protein